MAELKNIRIAISGIYDYALSELPSLRLTLEDGIEKKDIYKVYRPATVLAKAVKKFSMLPLTHHHPQNIVDGENFRELAIGYTGENPTVEYLDDIDEVGIRSAVMLYDEEAINAYTNGEVQLSPGYVANFKWQKGKTINGEEYDIVMTEITDVNHLALLPNGRGGDKAVILDHAPKKITVFDRVKGNVFERVRG